ncbi:hypothetical protein GCM10022243_42430 [Saccharothrix violaceirubra]|uniref:Putative HAF family extracellular repeat protein n=1 Tax=Saccharothrix violaceirubra TaxID=413306 RepID=A0A7W7T3D8_9PSEU|nr:hypothetical protein [Saccharothrix violaceirubra]MBB4965531.1 putative HAF family extracellular repeat protein [Saccharothrix violaceirubra]
MRRPPTLAAAVVLVLTAFPVPASASATVVDLGVLPGGDASRANAIDPAGTVVGHSTTTGGAVHAASWAADGRIADLGTLPGDTSSTADGISDTGIVFGHSYTDDGPTHAVRWVGGVIEELRPLPGHVKTVANAINARGTVVGVSVGTDYTDQHAVAWDRSGRTIALPALPGDPASAAISVNDAGVIVGHSGPYTAINDQHPLVWAPDGRVTRLSHEGADHGIAVGVNNAGTVAATIVDRDNHLNVVRFAPDGRGSHLGTDVEASAIGEDGTVLGSRSDLGRLYGARWRAGSTEAEFLSHTYRIAAVNRSGIAVGGTKSGPRGSRPMLWTLDENPSVDLPTLGGGKGIASDVDDRGTAVGSSPLRGGAWRAVKWQF